MLRSVTKFFFFFSKKFRFSLFQGNVLMKKNVTLF